MFGPEVLDHGLPVGQFDATLVSCRFHGSVRTHVDVVEQAGAGRGSMPNMALLVESRVVYGTRVLVTRRLERVMSLEYVLVVGEKRWANTQLLRGDGCGVKLVAMVVAMVMAMIVPCDLVSFVVGKSVERHLTSLKGKGWSLRYLMAVLE